MKRFMAGCALAVVAASAAHAQETTGTISGTVTAAGKGVPGAEVRIVNVPSGTTTTVNTNAEGGYVASGLRIGGPFTVAVTAPGYSSFTATDISTQQGQTFNLPIELVAQGQEIVVTASRIRGAGQVGFGPVKVLNAARISEIASVNRDIRDLLARDPFATLDTSQSTGRQVTFAGTNPRFNRFTVDGVPITDSFGLNPDALPSRRGPVPLDSIAQFESKVAPFDIREGFFQGGVSNAILKSGTNQFHGTGFFTFNNNDLVGDRTKPYITNQTGRINQPDFSSRDFGATLSGPLVKDRLFFMVSAERVRASLPVPYGTVDDNAGVPVVGLTSATFNQVTGIAGSKYGVNAGGILRNNGDKDDRIVGRIDANITDGQRLSFTGIYTKDSIITPGTTSNNQLSSLSDDYIKPNRTVAGVAQLNSDWSSVVSTELRVLYKDYQSGQTPVLANTATATVCTDAGTPAAITVGNATSCSANVASVIVGPQGSSQANILHVKTFGTSGVATFNFGDHRVRALAEYQDIKNYNLFVNGANGSYYFDTIAAFQAGRAQSLSFTNAPSLNPADAAARFKYQTYTFGLQDDWKVNSTLNLSYGLRYDLFGGNSEPVLNPFFVAREGFSNQYYINGKDLLQPRAGFSWRPTRRFDLHGGGGIFGGGTPDVYVGNSFSSTGILPANVTLTPANAGAIAGALNNVNLTQSPSGIGAALRNNPTSSVSALSPNFKIPSQWRASLSATYDFDLGPLGDHWQFGGDFLYTKTRNALFVQDLRNRPVVGANANTPDGRQRYFDIVGTQADPNGDYVLGNTHQGRGYVAVARFDKRWDFGLELDGSFTYQNVKDRQAFTSSVASSNYNNGAYLDPNGGAFGHSNDEVKYAFKYEVSFDHAFFGEYRTRINIFGQTRIGSPYSYTFQDPAQSGSNRSPVFGTVGSNSHYLFYVPTGTNDPKIIYDSVATQNAVNAIINSTGLAKYRGQIAPRNAFHSPWFTKIDIHLEQELPTFIGHSKISVFADIENFLNLVDHNLGQQLRSNFPFYKSVVQVACVAQGGNNCAQYRYSGVSSNQTLADQLVTVNGSSLYAIRVGARFIF
jgi:hypothetical protein